MKKKIIVLVSTLFIILLFFFTILISQKPQDLRQHAATSGYPHVVSTQVVDGNGSPLLLRGGMLPTSFVYSANWPAKDPTQILNTKTFTAMTSWKMNALRINVSQWIYQTNPTL